MKINSYIKLEVNPKCCFIFILLTPPYPHVALTGLIHAFLFCEKLLHAFCIFLCCIEFFSDLEECFMYINYFVWVNMHFKYFLQFCSLHFYFHWRPF